MVGTHDCDDAPDYHYDECSYMHKVGFEPVFSLASEFLMVTVNHAHFSRNGRRKAIITLQTEGLSYRQIARRICV